MSDGIDRQEAIDIVRNIKVKKVTPAYMLIDKAEVMTELMMMRPAEPERKKGKWIKRNGTINCSICKHSNWSECFEDTVMNFNYCPNCGADMRGELE